MKKMTFSENMELKESLTTEQIIEPKTIDAFQKTTLPEEEKVEMADLLGEESPESDGTVDYSVPTITKIESVTSISYVFASHGQAFKVTTGINYLPVNAGFKSNAGICTTTCALEFHFATSLPIGTVVELFASNGTKILEYTLSVALTKFALPVHNIFSDPEVKYFELYSEFILVISNPSGRQSTLATPGGVGMIIVANIGGGGPGANARYPMGTPYVPEKDKVEEEVAHLANRFMDKSALG